MATPVPSFLAPIVQLIFFLVFVLCLAGLMLRFFQGRTALDRLVIFESFVLGVLSLTAFYGLVVGTTLFMDVILLFSIVGFLSTVAAARFVENGDIFDDD
ncbi:MAG: monovalent cation/H+ antiporter complex subunit F [Sumerlaeia bacterium]